MMTDSAVERRYGISPAHAAAIIAACAMFMIALLAMLPDA